MAGGHAAAHALARCRTAHPGARLAHELAHKLLAQAKAVDLCRAGQRVGAGVRGGPHARHCVRSCGSGTGARTRSPAPPAALAETPSAAGRQGPHPRCPGSRCPPPASPCRPAARGWRWVQASASAWQARVGAAQDGRSAGVLLALAGSHTRRQVGGLVDVALPVARAVAPGPGAQAQRRHLQVCGRREGGSAPLEGLQAAAPPPPRRRSPPAPHHSPLLPIRVRSLTPAADALHRTRGWPRSARAGAAGRLTAQLTALIGLMASEDAL